MAKLSVTKGNSYGMFVFPELGIAHPLIKKDGDYKRFGTRLHSF
jgi:hypothetical protein